MGKVTISTVLGYKEYVVENIKSILGEDEENSDFRIYPDYHKIYRGQTEIVLTKAEYELFMLLSGRPGVIFTKHNERKCYGCSHYTGMLTGSISNGRRYGTIREKYSCDYDISICPYAAGKV